MEYVNCNCCESLRLKKIYEKPDEKFFPDEWFSVVECQDCGLGFVNPRPDKDEIKKYYPEQFFEYFTQIDHTKRYQEEAKYLISIEKSIKNPRLLDIGCANGDFPRYMKKRGWVVEGVETSDKTSQISDFVVHRGFLTELDLKKDHYDAVTAWAVLEHVHNPMEYFKRISEILKDKGRFVFLVNNFESPASRYLFLEDIPRHLYFFTPDTIKKYLNKNNLRLIKLDFNDKIYKLHSNYWLIFIIRKILGKDFKFTDIPITYREYITKNNLVDSFIRKIIFSLKNPLITLDYLLRPLYDKFLILVKKYGVIVVVAEKIPK